MIPIRDELTTKATVTSAGQIWFADATEGPRVFDGTLEDFVQRCRRRGVPVRLLGTRDNAELLVRLCLDNDGSSPIILIAGERACVSTAEKHDPLRVIYRMRQCLLSASLGGWHQADANDVATYSLLRALSGHDSAWEARLLEHPVWPLLSFVPQLHRPSVSLLLAEIIDPRWHVDADRPDRGARFKLFLGLTPWAGQAEPKSTSAAARAQRYQLALDSWAADGYPGDEIAQAPNQFLWRVWQKAGSNARGDLVATQTFAMFLRHAWLEALYANTRWSVRQGLFLPELLFNDPRETEAFQAHCRELRDGV